MDSQAQVDPAQVSAERPANGGALPTLVIIGAQKCGTSALWYYLMHHPQASVSTPKELDFFIEKRNWRKGVDWYKAQFDATKPVRADASPNYTAHPVHRGIFKRMHQVIPDAKLIYLVRDPVDRMAAQWIHNWYMGRHDGNLPELLRPRSTYLPRSCYGMQLMLAREYYPPERIMVLDQRDLRHKREETLRAIFTYADLDPDFTHPAFNTQRNKTERKKIQSPLGRHAEKLLPASVWAKAKDLPLMKMSVPVPDVRANLPEETLQFLRDDAKLFTELCGMDTSHWSIWR